MARRLEYGIHWIFLLALCWRPVEVPVGNFSQSMRNGKAAPQAVCPTWISTVPHPAPEWMRYNLCLVRVSMFRRLQPLLYKWLIVSGNMNMQARSFCTLLAKSKKPFEWNNLSMFGILGRPSHIILLLKQIKADILSRAAWVWRDSHSLLLLVHACQIVWAQAWCMGLEAVPVEGPGVSTPSLPGSSNASGSGCGSCSAETCWVCKGYDGDLSLLSGPVQLLISCYDIK